MSSISFTYKGMQMVVFDQIRVGWFRLYSAALPDEEKIIKDLWLKGKLGQKDGEGAEFTIMPIPDQVIGEEVFDKDHRIVAVFGYAASNSFVPSPEPQRKFFEKLLQIVQS